MKYTLELLLETFAVCRLDADAPQPDWAQGGFVSITRTPDELTVVCNQKVAPDHMMAERGWRCLKVRGKINFSLVGVITSLTKVLADEGVSVFVITTYDTDYFLVRQADVDRSVDALLSGGHFVQTPDP